MINTLGVFPSMVVVALVLLCNSANGISDFYNPLSPRIDPVFGNRCLMIDAGSSGRPSYIFTSSHSISLIHPHVYNFTTHFFTVPCHPMTHFISLCILGSRLHIFSWEPRIFDTVPPPLSIPRSDEKTTERISPGISDFVEDYPGLKKYFKTLIEECKHTLRKYEDDWHTYPFYLRATGQ